MRESITRATISCGSSNATVFAVEEEEEGREKELADASASCTPIGTETSDSFGGDIPLSSVMSGEEGVTKSVSEEVRLVVDEDEGNDEDVGGGCGGDDIGDDDGGAAEGGENCDESPSKAAFTSWMSSCSLRRRASCHSRYKSSSSSPEGAGYRCAASSGQESSPSTDCTVRNEALSTSWSSSNRHHNASRVPDLEVQVHWDCDPSRVPNS